MTLWEALALVAIFAVPWAVLLVVRRSAMRSRGVDPDGPERWKVVIQQTWGSQGPPGSTRDRAKRDQTWWNDRR